MRGRDLLVGQHHDAQLQFRNQRGARNVAREAAGVAHQLLAAIVAQVPAQAVGVEVRLHGGEGGGRILGRLADRQDGLRRPHLPGLRGAEQARLALGVHAPPFSCTIIHFARSSTQEMIEPAGALLSTSSCGSASSLPESALCGVATSLPCQQRFDVGERVASCRAA